MTDTMVWAEVVAKFEKGVNGHKYGTHERQYRTNETRLTWQVLSMGEWETMLHGDFEADIKTAANRAELVAKYSSMAFFHN